MERKRRWARPAGWITATGIGTREWEVQPKGQREHTEERGRHVEEKYATFQNESAVSAYAALRAAEYDAEFAVFSVSVLERGAEFGISRRYRPRECVYEYTDTDEEFVASAEFPGPGCRTTVL